jgi:hypothetical protein
MVHAGTGQRTAGEGETKAKTDECESRVKNPRTAPRGGKFKEHYTLKAAFKDEGGPSVALVDCSEPHHFSKPTGFIPEVSFFCLRDCVFLWGWLLEPPGSLVLTL